jgi:hypothetical protein
VLNEFQEDMQSSSFQEFASQALRLKRKGSFEQLLAQYLIFGVSSDPLTKVLKNAIYFVS